MTDWSEGRTQTYEYYVVDPDTWTDRMKLSEVMSSGIKREASKETLESASISARIDMGEFYVRIYLITIVDGLRDRKPLGTFLVQTSSNSFDGKVKEPTLTAYSPLLELKDVKPPLGYAIKKGAKALEQAYIICEQYCRAPIVPAVSESDMLEIDFIADPSDTWLSFLISLLSNAKHHLVLDEMGKIMFAPDQDTEMLQPVFTYNDDNSSILYPEITEDLDIYGIPNTLEVVYSGENLYLTATAINDDENSLISTVSRGRTVFEREENPGILGVPTQHDLEEYAEKTLKKMSEIECQLTYKHGFNEVRVGDCVRLNYKRAGYQNIKAKVISQDIDCTSECPVSETVSYKKKLWG